MWRRRRETKAKTSGEKREGRNEWVGKRREEREKEVLRGVGEGVSFDRARPGSGVREREREREDFTKRPVRRFHPHRKPTPTFTLAARPDDSMLKDGRLAG